MNTDIFYISTILKRLMSVCVISTYSKSSGSTFRSIQISNSASIGWTVQKKQKKPQGITHVLVIET